MITIDEQIAEIEREIAMREHVYPRWVASGKLKGYIAERRIAVMRAVLETLKKKKARLAIGQKNLFEE